jgi:hypothetical protein
MEVITSLQPHEVFVFGSNRAGQHLGGVAHLAHEKFGAQMGVGEGMAGQSYAFPTLDENMEQVSIEDIHNSVDILIETARNNPDKTFLITKVGCGIAGFDEQEIKSCFTLTKLPDNCVLPSDWVIA